MSRNWRIGDICLEYQGIFTMFSLFFIYFTWNIDAECTTQDEREEVERKSERQPK